MKDSVLEKELRGSYPRRVTIFASGFFTYLALVVAIGAQTLFLLRQVVRGDRVLLSLGICFVADMALIIGGVLGLGALTERVPWLVTALTVAGVAYLLWFAASSFRSAWKGETTLTSAATDAAEHDPAAAPDAVDLGLMTGELPVIDGEMLRQYRAREAAPEPMMSARGGTGVEPGAGRSGTDRDGAERGVAVKSRVRRASPRTSRAERRESVTRMGMPMTPVGKIWALCLSVSLLNPHAILDTVVMLPTIAYTYGEGMATFMIGSMVASAVWFVVLGWGGTKLAPLMNTPRMWRIVDTIVGVLMVGIAVKIGLGLL